MDKAKNSFRFHFGVFTKRWHILFPFFNIFISCILFLLDLKSICGIMDSKNILPATFPQFPAGTLKIKGVTV